MTSTSFPIPCPGATFEREGELLGQPCQNYRHPHIKAT